MREGNKIQPWDKFSAALLWKLPIYIIFKSLFLPRVAEFIYIEGDKSVSTDEEGKALETIVSL